MLRISESSYKGFGNASLHSSNSSLCSTHFKLTPSCYAKLPQVINKGKLCDKS